MIKSRVLKLAMGAGLALTAGASNAAFITGSISFVDGGTRSYAAHDVYRQPIDSFDVNNVLNVFSSGTGAFSGTASALAFDFSTAGLPVSPWFTTDDGFTFTLTSISVDSSQALTCAGGLCTDNIALDVQGVVSAAGFDDTLFLGGWTAQGTCLGDSGECDSDVSASWSSSLTATGREVPTEVPEPSILALFGLGLLGMAAVQRRRARS